MKYLYISLILLLSNLSISQNSATGPSTEVGVTQGKLAVSPTGSAIYSIPILVPPGIGEIKPNISLTYNSQSGNALVGYGWNISGISVISRIPATLYHDGFIDGVDYDRNDRFALDGQRLILKTGTYGGDGAEYQTELSSHLRIRSFGVSTYGAAYGPAYFTVEYPDGSKAFYGNGVNKYSRNDFAISSWQNSAGVRIDYAYFLNENSLVPMSIRYGSTALTDHPNTITFDYLPRQKNEQSYINGQSCNQINKLASISVLNTGATIYRKYTMTYETTNLGFERLIKVTERAGGLEYNPTVFTYNETGEMSFNATSSPLSGLSGLSLVDQSAIQGDFNGDGKIDCLIYPTTGASAKSKYWLATDLGGNTIQPNVNNIGKFDEIFTASTLNSSNKLSNAQSWVAILSSTQPNPGQIKFNIYDNSSNLPQYTRQYNFRTSPIVSANEWATCSFSAAEIPKHYINGDFNGDGLTDVIAIEKFVTIGWHYNCGGPGGDTDPMTFKNYGGQSYFINLDRRIESNFAGTAGNINLTANSKIYTGDYNGDGKTDLYLFDVNKIYIYELNSSNQLQLLTTLTSNFIKINHVILMGDYNGDGKTDFLIPVNDNVDQWCFFFSTGNGFVTKTSPIGSQYTINNSFSGYYGISGWDPGVQSYLDISHFATDINGDGKTDILIQMNYTTKNSGQPQITYYGVWENNSVTPSQIHFNYTYVFAQSAGVGRFPIPIITNHNNINRNLELGLVSGSSVFNFKNNKNLKKLFLLKDITTGQGVVERINYRPLTEQIDSGRRFYKASPLTETFPNVDLVALNDVWVVSSIEQLSNLENKKQHFSYFGGVTNFEGLGFLGFRNTLKSNWYSDNTPIVTTITKYDINLRGIDVETYETENPNYNFEVPPTTYINKETKTWLQTIQANKIRILHNTEHSILNQPDNTIKYSGYAFNGDNFVSTHTYYSKSGNITDQSGYTNYTYISDFNSTLYYAGIPKSKFTHVEVGGETSENEEIYSYSNLFINSIKKKGTNVAYYVEEFRYLDAVGNIIKKSITVPGQATRTEYFEYDISKRFLTKHTSINGLSTVYTVHPKTGLVLSETDKYGRTSQYEYDVWGKRIKVIDYLGKKSLITYSNVSGGGYRMITNDDDGSSNLKTFDIYGRQSITGKKNVDNSWSYIKTKYDVNSRIIAESEPYSNINAQPTLNTHIKYDSRGRIIQKTDPSQLITNISYSGLTATSSNGIKSVVTKSNSLSQIITVTENGSTINYQYFPNGNLKKTDLDGVITEFEEDGWGRRTKLKDPSAGTFEYAYSNFGELVHERSPRGEIFYTYNDGGKLTEMRKVGMDENSKTIYTYNSYQLLIYKKFEDLINGYFSEYTYEYDDYRRIFRTGENTFLAYFQNAILYDDFGKAKYEYNTAVHPLTGKRVDTWTEYNYRNGYHYQTLEKDTGKILWQLDNVNVRGQIYEMWLGNGIHVQKSYDNLGFPLRMEFNNTIGQPVNLMDINTEFNPQTGNLLYRRNNLFGKEEFFQYDSADRLIEYTNYLGDQIHQFYDGKGRITENSLGTYEYGNSNKPYQNTAINISESAKSYYQNRIGIFSEDFEKKAGWSSNDNDVDYDSSLTHSGNSSLRIGSAYGGYAYATSLAKTKINNSEDTEYLFSGWIYNNGGENQITLLMSVSLEDSNPTENNISMGGVGYWKYVEQIVLVPSHIKYLNLKVGSYSTGFTYFDDLKIIKRTDATPNRKLGIRYNSNNDPIEINETGIESLNYYYHDNGERYAMFYGSTNPDINLRPNHKYYSSNGKIEIKYDKVSEEVEFIVYIGGDAYEADVILKSDGEDSAYFYLLKDHQGTINAIVDDEGLIREKRIFDAWGNVLRVEDAHGNYLSGLTFIDRGYTSHEHLIGVNLVHMNGRLYDPVVHRFLQPDNYIQDPFNTQNFNRYGYVLNNPLKYTDKTGEFWNLIVGAVIGGVTAAVQGGDWRDIVGGAMIGCISAAIGSGVANVVAGGAFYGTAATSVSGFWSGAAVGAAGGFAGAFTATMLNSWMNGASFIYGVESGFKSGIYGAAVGGVVGGVAAGVKALEGETNFWTGKNTIDLKVVTGGRYAFNKVMNGKIKIKFVGIYEDVKIYESTSLGNGDRSGGLTLPPNKIIVGKGTYRLVAGNDYVRQLFRHEYGHILQYRLDYVGYSGFYGVIAPESAISASMHGKDPLGLGVHNHNTFWTEKWANYLAEQKFGPFMDPKEFPSENISKWNRNKF